MHEAVFAEQIVLKCCVSLIDKIKCLFSDFVLRTKFGAIESRCSALPCVDERVDLGGTEQQELGLGVGGGGGGSTLSGVRLMFHVWKGMIRKEVSSCQRQEQAQ